MASSQRALRLLGRSMPPVNRLARRISSPAARAAPETDKKPFQNQALSQVRSPQVAKGTIPSAASPPSSPEWSSVSKLASALHNPPLISADERPPYQYPTADPTPLPSVPSSYENNQAAPAPSLKVALDSGSPTHEAVDWGSSYHGLSAEPFSDRAQAILQAPIPMDDVEVKPDGIIYLPEIKYRRILNNAFGPGGWGLAPRGELHVGDKVVTREFALVVGGRFVAQARGECGYFGEENIPNGVEGCKSNALTRCCKDLGIASELWDPRFIRKYMKEHTKVVDVIMGSAAAPRKKRITMRKDDEVMAPYRLADPKANYSNSSSSGGGGSSWAASSAAKPAAYTPRATSTSSAAKPSAAAAKPAGKTSYSTAANMVYSKA